PDPGTPPPAEPAPGEPAPPAEPAPEPEPEPAPGTREAIAKRIAAEKELRQNTNPQIQLLALQFQATRCGEEDVLAGNDDPELPLITCRSEEHTSELQSRENLVGRLLHEKKK